MAKLGTAFSEEELRLAMTFDPYATDWAHLYMRAMATVEKLREAERIRKTPRNGASTECGCWYYANAGDRAGRPVKCPKHGDTRFVKMNVDEPDVYTPPPEWRHDVRKG